MSGRGRRPARRGPAGFTLVELMVALVVSSLLIGMILSIFSRMSMAYRAQQNVAELQQTLAAAQAMLQRDLRQTGYQIPHGFVLASDTANVHLPLQVINNADGFGPDQVRIYYADATAQARVVASAAPFNTVSVDNRDLFEVGDVVVMVGRNLDMARRLPTIGDLPVNEAPRFVEQWACVVQIQAINATTFTLSNVAPWGAVGNPQCDDVHPVNVKMLYRFAARAYRIDPARRNLAVLQLSPSGGLVANDWQDLGVGFTDLQIATRWNNWATIASPDPDQHGTETWKSGENQETTSAPKAEGVRFAQEAASEARLSLVVRTLKASDAISTAATPLLTNPANVDGNDLGDRPSIALAGVPDAARPVELRGEAILRHATIGADLRNLAVGQ